MRIVFLSYERVCGRKAYFTWLSHNTCACPAMRGMSLLAYVGSPACQHLLVGMVFTTVVWTWSVSLKFEGVVGMPPVHGPWFCR